MSNSSIPLRRITLYKNDLGYFERTTTKSSSPAVLQVAKKQKKLVIDTLCTTANTVTFDTEEYEKYAAANATEHYFSFVDLTSTRSFADFLQTCTGADVILSIKGENEQQTGKLLMLHTEEVLLSPTSSEKTTHYFVKILTNDGFIRQFDRKYSFENRILSK